ncbi:MAG: RecQ family ATP-dependent DNA helicase [Gemmatimonadetes bacterium]|nr:RecQ family ATP-dependent DNA helicase [Gemmatimonadota bacterium]
MVHDTNGTHESTVEARGLQLARAALARHFGYDDFRGAQEEAVRAVLDSRDVLVLMPTGGGKSLCYQIPALVLNGLTLVVSPLISLMKDQVDALARRGIAATFINSSLPRTEADARLAASARGEVKLLYVAPERFEADAFRRALPRLDVRLLAVDEAHCISEWGYGFRPSYLRLGRVRTVLRCPVMALTATATPGVREDILLHLGLRRPVILARGFDRPNLGWHVIAARDTADKDALMVRALRAVSSGSAIVYAPTRRSVDSIADLLHHAGIRAAAYHGGAAAADRQRIQEEFVGGDRRVIVATSAFGMGIDKSDVRLVLHFAMPSSLESYYQEAGRAGRDGGAARCVLLHTYADRFTHEFLIDQAHPPLEAVRAVWSALRGMTGTREVIRCDLHQLSRRVPLEGGARQLDSVLRLFAMVGAAEIHVNRSADRDDGIRHIRLAIDSRERDLPVDGRLLGRARERDRQRLEWMQRYVYTRGCRRAFILNYFGDGGALSRCTDCDRCARPGHGVAAGARAPGGSQLLLRLRSAVRRFRF